MSIRPSKMHGTVCRCGQEEKEVWKLVGPKCWSRVPKNLRDEVWRLYKDKSTRGKGEHRAACRAVIEWLTANPQRDAASVS